MAYVGMFFFSLILLVSLVSQLALPTARARNYALLVTSLLFYFFGGLIYILLLVLMTLLFWYCGMMMPEAKGNATRKLLLALPVAFSLILLFLCKYTTPLLETTRQMFRAPQVVPQIVMPLGISVYTLNLISYLTDVYREKLQPEENFLSLLTYSSLIHVCLGGPIVYYRDLRQRLSARKPHPQNISVGVTLFSLGVFKVVLLSVGLAALCSGLLPRSNQGLLETSALVVLLGVILSGVRVYLLLSGYSEIAMGLGLMTGLRYPENFSYPLLSCSVKHFYEKWFITLSAFLREYVAEPITALSPKCKTLGAVLSYVLFGLWFGGTPNFLLLGFFLAIAILLEEHPLQKLPIAARRVLGVLGIFVIFFLLSFYSLPRLYMGLTGLLGLNPGGLFQKAQLLPLLHALPLILLSICFCLPLGQILRGLLHSRFEEKAGAMTIMQAVESIYPLALLILTGVLLLLGKTETFLIL